MNMNPSSFSSSASPQVPSQQERKFYYFGLQTAPVLVARTSTTPWEAPPSGTDTGSDTNPEAYARRKVVRLVGDHPTKHLWGGELEPKLHTLLDSMEVKQTDVDIIRIGFDGEPPLSAPVILWIEVIPGSLASSDGITVAQKCRKILEDYGINDVDVEIHEPPVT